MAKKQTKEKERIRGGNSLKLKFLFSNLSLMERHMIMSMFLLKIEVDGEAKELIKEMNLLYNDTIEESKKTTINVEELKQRAIMMILTIVYGS